jgi:hypothetical protein
MASPDAPLRMWCWPGPRSAVGARETDTGRPALAMFVDPITFVAAAPPFPGGELALARFCRQLARSAWRLAGDLDPSGQPVSPEPPRSRHAASPRERGVT